MNRMFEMKQGAHAASEYGAVIPLNEQRTPLVAFDDATRDPIRIAELWTRYPAAGVGVIANSLMNLLVVDVEDPSKKPGTPDGRATMRGLCRRLGQLPRTRIHTTKSGGMHCVFRLPATVSLRTSHAVMRGLPPDDQQAPGVDFVTGRQSLRWVPTPGYRVDGAVTEVKPLPARWIAALIEPPMPPREAKVLDSSDRLHRYIRCAVEGECERVSQTQSLRNCALYAAAAKLGALCEYLSDDQIIDALLPACERNGSLKEHGQRTCIKTILAGIKAGAKNPRVITTR